MGPMFFGDAGNGRNPRVGEHVLFRQCPSVHGKVVAEATGPEGNLLFKVEWYGSPIPCSWHPAEGLCEDDAS